MIFCKCIYAKEKKKEKKEITANIGSADGEMEAEFTVALLDRWGNPYCNKLVIKSRHPSAYMLIAHLVAKEKKRTIANNQGVIPLPIIRYLMILKSFKV